MQTVCPRTRLLIWPCIMCFALAVIDVRPVGASDRSQRLAAQGVARLQAEQYDEALLLLDQAIEADPTDASAYYYRGICRGRMNQTVAAVADLRTAVATDPAFTPASLELGVALIQTGAYQEALAPLQRAQQDPTLAARASLFLGIAQLRLDHPDLARPALERAALDPTLAVAAAYYLGVVAYRAQQWDEATRQFQEVAQRSPDSSMGQEAAAFLARLQHPASERYQLYASAGLQYDSNVVIAPATDIPALGISQQADGRVVLNAGGDFIPWQNEQAKLVVGYDFFQSLQFELHDFNLQDNRFSAQLVGNWDWLRVGGLARYSYYLLETSSFLQEITGLPWVSAQEGDRGRTELYFRTRYRDFFLLPYNPQLNAVDYAVGLRQFLFLGNPDRWAAIGYQFDANDPTSSSGAQFGYNGNEVNVGAGWDLPWSVTTEVGYSYRHEEYAPASDGRVDNPNQFLVAARRPLSDHFAISLAYFGTIHNSNVAEFDYNRNIGSVIVEATY